MKKIHVYMMALSAFLLLSSAFAVPFSIVYTGRVVKPGSVGMMFSDVPTNKNLNVSIKNAKDETLWGVENAVVQVQTNGMFTIELKDEIPGLLNGHKSLKEVCASGEASQIIVEIPGSTYMSREEFVPTPLVDNAAVATKFSSTTDAFVLQNLSATQINLKKPKEIPIINNMVISNSLTQSRSYLKYISSQYAKYRSYFGYGIDMRIDEINYSGISGIKLNKEACYIGGSSAEPGKLRVFDDVAYDLALFNPFYKNDTVIYYENLTLLISASNRDAMVYTQGKKSGILLITGSLTYPGVIIPFSGEDIKWPFKDESGKLTMFFFPFGVNK